MYKYWVTTSIPILGKTTHSYTSMVWAVTYAKFFIEEFGCEVNIKQEKVMQ